MCTYLTGPSALFWMITVDRLIQKGMGQIFVPIQTCPREMLLVWLKGQQFFGPDNIET